MCNFVDIEARPDYTSGRCMYSCGPAAISTLNLFVPSCPLNGLVDYITCEIVNLMIIISITYAYTHDYVTLAMVRHLHYTSKAQRSPFICWPMPLSQGIHFER
ncbi:hypothetical protein NP493_228g00039 [Ridgeia piscesae]|uniref:Uncharacterized protein n=1 Tax=Ridgeia piscesae TaxID=27915 RepID=A0AAD9NZV1_RIDPI|nr:hypothetical protein NP493_228g00039 [Ridgeia piscesae]